MNPISEPVLRIRVDPTNPGQFFACCGLLELADRLWGGAEGSHPLQLDLREGCLLCELGDAVPYRLVRASGKEDDFEVDYITAESYAEQAAKRFFGDRYEQKDYADEKFETGVANKFLAMTAESRKKLARNGAITEDAIRAFEEKGRDPLKSVLDAIKEAKKALPEALRRNAAAIIVPDAFALVSEKLSELTRDEQLAEPVKECVVQLQGLIAADQSTHGTVKELEKRIKEFNRQQKASASATTPETPDELR